MEDKAPYKPDNVDLGGNHGRQWVVLGPGFDGIGGCIRSLDPINYRPSLDETSASILASCLNDVWACSRWQKERELRAAFGLKEWAGQLEVAR